MIQKIENMSYEEKLNQGILTSSLIQKAFPSLVGYSSFALHFLQGAKQNYF